MPPPETHQRSLWQVLGLYLAGSWLCLQVIDVLDQNIGMPGWLFPLTLALLAMGLPVVALTAYLHGTGRSKAGSSTPAARPGLRRVFTWKNAIRGGVGALALWGVAVTAWVAFGDRASASAQDVVAGLDEVRSLAGARQWSLAYARALDLDPMLQDDSLRAAMWGEVSRSVELATDPPGAMVSRRHFDAPPDAEWDVLGRTPLTVEHFPFGVSRLRFELDGYLPLETAGPSSQLAAAGSFVLDRVGTVPEGMTRVAGGSAKIWAPGLEQLDSLDIGDFFMARNEVTNQAYQAFVDAGGYRDPGCWEHPFVLDGAGLTFEQAMARFVDRTGRPGPAGWEVGRYPEGEGQLPVGGVSWFEAMAYACFLGQSLPTVYHWYTAADPFSSNHIIPLSNYGDGPAPVGTYQGVTRNGIHDMAGNVAEWTANRAVQPGDARFLLGGSWDDLEYSFNDAITAPAWSRSPGNGIRLVQYIDTMNVARAGASIEPEFRDYRAERPVADDVFQVYRQLYAYDRTPLNAERIAADTLPGTVRQRIEMDAAYGSERLTVFVYLPPTGTPPYETVVYFPGSGDIYRRSYNELDASHLDFLLRSGRAVIYPIYRGTWERGTELASDIQDESVSYREHVIAWVRDFSRTVDYVESRPDLDQERIAYLGISWGGAVAPLITAIETRLRASVLIAAGLAMQKTQPMVDPFHFLPRVTVPTLVLNGRYDSFFPLETSQKPFFDLLGTPPDRKKLIVTDANHFVLSYENTLVVRETLDWLDRWLGEAR